MSTFQELLDAHPEWMEQARARVDKQIVLLATVRKDGAPRLHPVRPFLSGDGRLIVFSSPGSPKTADLRRDGRVALHPGFDRESKTGGEVLLSGRASELDAEDRALVADAAPFDVGPGILFAISLERVVGLFELDGQIGRVRYNAQTGAQVDEL